LSAYSVGAPSRFVDRLGECQTLDRLLHDALAGRSRVAVLRGDAGVGKSALLHYVSLCAADCRVATAVGVESEMELPYSALHQLCAPMLDLREGLPVPQRQALETVFGLSARPAPDRFLVALGTLTLLAEVAERQPLVCIVDDAQWLDQASAQILGFVARRLLAERIALVCAARTGVGDEVLVGLPEIIIRGLADKDARELLLDNVHGPLDRAICDQIVAESRGNPLALLELPRTYPTGDLAGGFGLPDNPVASSRALLNDGASAEELFREAIEQLSRTPMRPELARAHLVYGEWLRREGQRSAAREQLRTAHNEFVAIGMDAFADRAHRELLAAGDRPRTGSGATRTRLSPQEDQIARMAGDGLSNPEIGAQLFISARTVEWHLRKVFGKLRITSRRELPRALADTSRGTRVIAASETSPTDR
jgi:DNA-binding CsgD family transcriptional regulator